MTGVATALVLVIGVSLLAVGLVRLAILPWAIVFELRGRSKGLGPAGCGPLFIQPPLVSVIIPAFEEGRVIGNCIQSLLRSDHARLEIVCVDDGSADDTYEWMRHFAAADPRVQAIRQANGGKGSALNTGIAASHGEVLLLADADGIFRPDTVTRLLRGFRDEKVGAVCGNDRPVNTDRILTRLLALISHVGTGLMRRALDTLGCLPIVSGNIGAFRRDVLEQTGPVDTSTLGEDLELTWRVHRSGYQVAFAPDAVVYAESPSTLRGLWRQRVRWARGLLQVTALHRRMVGNPRYGAFGIYLLFNTVSQVIAPFLQVLGAIALVVLVAVQGTRWLPESLIAWILFVGLGMSVVLLLAAVLVDRAPRDLRHAWTIVLWPLYSTLMTFVILDAARLELSNAENRWNKLERTGTVSVDGLVDDQDPGPS